jgi:hypothetical protein
MRWRLALPFIGLILFAGVTYRSLRIHRALGSPSRYFWWSSIRLDSDPLDKKPHSPVSTGWDLRNMWVDPGWVDQLLFVSALPAFAAGAIVVSGLGRLGISEVSSFMISVPLFIFAWYYFLGWLIQRWTCKRGH